MVAVRRGKRCAIPANDYDSLLSCRVIWRPGGATSSPDAGGRAMSPEENKALIRRLGAALNSGGVDAGLDLFADSCLYNGHPVGREVIRQLRTILWTAAPDVQWLEEHVFA